jgi:hypothetical protein
MVSPTSVPPQPHDSMELLLLTTVLSHVAMMPTAVMLYRRKWVFESASNVFCILTSFMYHLTQCIGRPFFLSELKWHRLDNIGVLIAFGLFFIYLANIRDPTTELWLKFATMLVALVTQEKAPWDVRYTFGPILMWGSLPVFWHLFVHRRPPVYDWRQFTIGFAALLVAAGFFVRGLDDKTDPSRFFHGMWHVVGGVASYHLWRIVLKPSQNAFAQFLNTGKARDENNLLPV